MPKTMEILDISPELLETITETFNTEYEMEMARKIVDVFLTYELPVKVKQYYQPCMIGTYRIICFIKKSAEAVIINNKGTGRDGVSVQVRVDDKSTLSNLDNFSENIRSQILNSNDCGNCSSKCENKKYIFSYQGITHIKCHFLCSNFSFQNVNKDDIDNLIEIINNEIAYKQTRRK